MFLILVWTFVSESIDLNRTNIQVHFVDNFLDLHFMIIILDFKNQIKNN